MERRSGLLKHPDSERKTESCLLHRENPVACVPAGVWMAARSEGDFSLVSCCVGPGFSFDDFEMLRHVDASVRPTGIDPIFI